MRTGRGHVCVLVLGMVGLIVISVVSLTFMGLEGVKKAEQPMATEKLLSVVIDGEEWVPRRLLSADRRTPLVSGDAAVVEVNGDKWIVPGEIAAEIDRLRRIEESAGGAR